MNAYITHFAIYTLAMTGFIVMALYVYKKSLCAVQNNKNKDFLAVENCLKLSATKTVYVIKAGKEKFLIAGDSANTTMLAKLESGYDESINTTNTTPITDNVTVLSSLKNIAQKINRG